MKVFKHWPVSKLTRAILNLAGFILLADLLVVVISALVLILLVPDLFPNLAEGETIKVLVLGGGLSVAFTDFQATASLILFRSGESLLYLGIGSLIIYQLRHILSAMECGALFTSKNKQRIRLIGYALMAEEFLRGLILYLMGRYLAKVLVIPGLNIFGRFDFNWIVVSTGLTLLILAEVFGPGAALQKKQREVI